VSPIMNKNNHTIMKAFSYKHIKNATKRSNSNTIQTA
jgi:hypothetical protein